MSFGTPSTRLASKARTLSRRLNVPSYQRPQDWPALPIIGDTEQKFAGLFAVHNIDSNFCSFTVSGACTIDWGDGGATENVASNVQANHQYVYASVPGSATSRGYKTAIVTIVPQAANNLTSINLQKKSSLQSPLPIYDFGWLDISLTAPLLTTLTISTQPGVIILPSLLEHVRIGPNIVTSWNDMFNSCVRLQCVQRLETGSATTMWRMFEGCVALPTVPLFNMASVTQCFYMFNNCTSLVQVPLFNTVLVSLIRFMFRNCTALVSVPTFNTAAATDFEQMFYLCTSLLEAPPLNTASASTLQGMFQSCQALTKVPTYTLAANVNLSFMFSSCVSLVEVPAWAFSGTTVNCASMFAGCISLARAPAFTGQASVSNAGSMFQSCNSMGSLTFDLTNSTASVNFAANCNNLGALITTGSRFTLSTIAQSKLSKAALEAWFTSLGKSNSLNASMTVTGNYGAVSATASVTTTAGSTTATCAATGTMAAGNYIFGTGISTDVAITIDTTADTIGRTAHGIPNDTLVSLMTLVTSTGIAIFTPYYVVNAAANTLQLALTQGGAAINITGSNGSGTLRYPTTITAVTPNTNITLSIAASASGTATMTYTALNRTIATLKGYAIT